MAALRVGHRREVPIRYSQQMLWERARPQAGLRRCATTTPLIARDEEIDLLLRVMGSVAARFVSHDD
jgi:hypothetical protein